MHYYWEPSHYRANVGSMVMQSMFGGAARRHTPAGFGVELTPRNIAAHLREQRGARDRYMSTHPVEVHIARKAVQR